MDETIPTTGAKKWKLVYECSSQEQRDMWKEVFDASIALLERIEAKHRLEEEE